MKKPLLRLSIAMAVLSGSQAAKQPNLLILFTDMRPASPSFRRQPIQWRLW